MSIEPNVELTLDNSTNFHVFDSKVIIEHGKNDIDKDIHIPGVKIIVDGATITRVCDIPWNGTYL